MSNIFINISHCKENISSIRRVGSMSPPHKAPTFLKNRFAPVNFGVLFGGPAGPTLQWAYGTSKLWIPGQARGDGTDNNAILNMIQTRRVGSMSPPHKAPTFLKNRFVPVTFGAPFGGPAGPTLQWAYGTSKLWIPGQARGDGTDNNAILNKIQTCRVGSMSPPHKAPTFLKNRFVPVTFGVLFGGPAGPTLQGPLSDRLRGAFQ